MSLESRRDQLLRCDRANNCKWVPAASTARFASACPSIEYGQFHAYSGSGKIITAFGLLEGRLGITDEMLRGVYACSACGACDTACKWNHQDLVNPLDTIYELRSEIVTRGKALPAHVAAIENIRATGNRFGAEAGTRSAWASQLAIKNILENPAPVLLHIGCENAFEPSQWPELRAIVALLKRAGVDFGILHDAEVDCGSYAFDIGFRDDATSSARQLAELIARSGAATVVTCSAVAYSAFRNIYPRLGVSVGAVQVEHISETVENLIASGALRISTSASGTVTYHDSCKLGRLGEVHSPQLGRRTRALNQMETSEPQGPVAYGNGGLYDSPRRLLDNAGVRRVEMPRNRQFAYCCGALGGGKEAYPAFASHAAKERLTEAESTGAEVLVSACGACTSHLRNVAGEGAMAIKVKGLFEHLANAIAPEEKGA